MTDSFKKKLDKQSRISRQDNMLLAEKLAGLQQTLSVMKKYSDAEKLTQKIVQELIDKIIVMDPEHVEIVWKFKDEVRNKRICSNDVTSSGHSVQQKVTLKYKNPDPPDR